MSNELKKRAQRLRVAATEVLKQEITVAQSLELIAKVENYPTWDAAVASFPAVREQQYTATGVAETLALVLGVKQGDLRVKSCSEKDVFEPFAPLQESVDVKEKARYLKVRKVLTEEVISVAKKGGMIVSWDHIVEPKSAGFAVVKNGDVLNHVYQYRMKGFDMEIFL